MARAKIGILVSGRGSNMRAIVEAARSPEYPAEIALVFSNKPDAPALDYARDNGIATASLHHKGLSREAFDAEVVRILREHGCEFVVMAGFTRIVTPVLLDAFAQRVVNIHPSLLPAFPGAHGQRDALEYGCKVAGCTVHFVDAGTDSGPIVAQAAVPVLAGDTEETLSARILVAEHKLYPQVVAWLASRKLRIVGRTVEVLT